MNKIAVIPAYEPDEKMLPLLKELKENNYEIIVIDDGSGPSYKKIFAEAKPYSHLLVHEVNKGKGAALKTAFSYIEKHYKEYYIVTLDCDGQHRIKDANKLLKYLETHPKELVLGKRLRGEKTPLRSKLGNSITRAVYHLITRVDVYDTQTGLRAFTNELMPYMLNVPGERFEYEMNMLLYCPKNNIKITEIEIETIYFNNNSKSHFNTVKDSLRIYKQIFKFSCSSLISFLVDYALFIIFNLLFQNILPANILARVFSSALNYNLNKKLVFSKNNKYSLLKYYALVVIILLLNTLLLELFVKTLLMNEFLAKVIVEVLLFILSYIVQRIYVFKEKD